jgi:hypothetical protein
VASQAIIKELHPLAIELGLNKVELETEERKAVQKSVSESLLHAMELNNF